MMEGWRKFISEYHRNEEDPDVRIVFKIEKKNGKIISAEPFILPSIFCATPMEKYTKDD